MQVHHPPKAVCPLGEGAAQHNMLLWGEAQAHATATALERGGEEGWVAAQGGISNYCQVPPGLLLLGTEMGMGMGTGWV